MDDAGLQVDVGDPQRGALRQPQPGVCTHQDRRPHSRGNGVVERPHLLGRGDVGPLLAHRRGRTPRARVAGDQPVVDRIGEELRQPRVQRVDVRRRPPLLLELRGPRPHVRRLHRRERHGAEVRPDDLQMDLGHPHARLPPVAVAGQPGVAPLPHRQSSRRRARRGRHAGARRAGRRATSARRPCARRTAGSRDRRRRRTGLATA